MKRTSLLRATPTTATLTVKPSKCKACRLPFFRASAWQTHCRSEACAVAALEAAREKREKAEAIGHRLKLADCRPLSHWHALTQAVVNALVQARDKGKPCISCGTETSVQFEAGHWLSRGANPALRYDLANINLQCHGCNVFKSGNQAAYRVGLVARIGLAEVERLEGPQPLAKHTRESLAALRKWASAETRRIKRDAG